MNTRSAFSLEKVYFKKSGNAAAKRKMPDIQESVGAWFSLKPTQLKLGAFYNL